MEDQKIKDLLENYEVQFNPEHWDKMKTKIDDSTATEAADEDKYFDRFVRAEVEMQQTPFNPAHWEKMTHLVEKKSFAGRVRKYRLLEILCLLLLTWTTWFVRESAKVIDSVDYAALFATKVKPANQVALINIPHSEKSSISNNRLLNNTKLLTINPLPIQLITGIPNTIAQPNFKAYPILANNLDNRYKPSVLYNSNNSSNSNINPSPIFGGLNSNFSRSANSTGLRLGVYASSNFDETNVLNQEKTNKDSYYALGIGAGLSVAWKLDRLELETGAAFNSVREIDLSKEDLTAFDKTVFEEKQITNLVRLPLVLKYLFKDYGKWKIYALGGGNLNLDITQNSLTSNNPDPVFAAARSKSKSDNIQGEPNSFIDRFYYTTTIGIGVERKLSDRFSVFVQPEYFHQLNRSALAPSRGPSNSLAVSMGLKTHI